MTMPPVQSPQASHTPQMNPGVNLRPGPSDDGWISPPPVILDDGSKVLLFKDGEALQAAYHAIESARKRICVEVYIFANDQTGHSFAELLARKARSGVPTYLIYDDVGSYATPRAVFKHLRLAGVKIRTFHPIRPWECTFSWRPFNRDHRKLLVVDDHIAGLGGLNVGAEYAGSWIGQQRPSLRHPLRALAKAFPNSSRSPDIPAPSQTQACDFWRDNAIGITGPTAHVLQQSFYKTWQYLTHGGRISKALHLHPPPEGTSPPSIPSPSAKPSTRNPQSFQVPTHGNQFSLIASVPTLDSPLRPTLHRLFASARKSIRMTMAYFAPDDDLIATLCRAARRGVDVRLMLPGKCDVPILITAARSFYETLLSAGVHIYERQAVVLHAKTMVIDNHISIIGSTNLDFRSLEYNLELSGVITSHEFGAQMSALFDNDVLYAKKINPQTWKRRPTSDRLTQWLVSRARYLL